MLIVGHYKSVLQYKVFKKLINIMAQEPNILKY